MKRLTKSLRYFVLALQFFTRIPVTGRLGKWVNYSPEALRESAAYVPAIGWVVGTITALSYWLIASNLPDLPATPLVAAFASTFVGLMLTGAFHEDGLADLTDGLGGSMKREQALEIMKDSRIGSFGSLALIIALGGKISLLTLLGQKDILLACWAIFGAHISSRFAPLFVIRFQSHVGDEAGSKSKPLSDAISWSTFSVGTIWWLASLILLDFLYADVPWWGAIIGTFVTLIWMFRLLAKRLGGFTGDGLGATQQLCEIGFYLGLLLVLKS
jgi:adenosylcobinamide-GDP ribazoletransferase